MTIKKKADGERGVDGGKTQLQRFKDAARELGASEDEYAFRKAVKRVATAPSSKPKKSVRKSK